MTYKPYIIDLFKQLSKLSRNLVWGYENVKHSTKTYTLKNNFSGIFVCRNSKYDWLRKKNSQSPYRQAMYNIKLNVLKHNAFYHQKYPPLAVKRLVLDKSSNILTGA